MYDDAEEKRERVRGKKYGKIGETRDARVVLKVVVCKR